MAASGTLTFAPGADGGRRHRQGHGDDLSEGDEIVLVSTSAPSNARLGPYLGLGHGVVLDDDGGVPKVRPGAGSAPEGSSLTIPVRLSHPSSTPVSVAWRAAAHTASADDFVAASGTLTFAAGQTEATVTIATTADDLDEPDEDLVLVAVRPGRRRHGRLARPRLGTIPPADPSLAWAANPGIGRPGGRRGLESGMNRCGSCGEAVGIDARFCGECGAPSPCSAPPVPHRSPRARSSARHAAPPRVEPEATPGRAAPEIAVAGELRVVSVIFCDLVGFTSRSESLDPDIVRELLSGYFDDARAIIGRHGGTIEKFIGDAVMAVWGVPIALENDAECAVRASLELVDAVHAFGEAHQLEGLAARVGVVTGQAVAMDSVAEGIVVGDRVNTAARIQGLAEPGTVYVDETTRAATAAAIAYRDAGEHLVKGKAEPVPVWRAERAIAGALGVNRGDSLEAVLVGRDSELRLLKELFHTSTEGGAPDSCRSWVRRGWASRGWPGSSTSTPTASP